MIEKTIHILNGDSLTPRLKEIGVGDDQLVWREMLCEGTTVYDLNTDAFKKARIDYLKPFIDTEITYDESFLIPLLTTNFAKYTSIILWFEYDLFCHINMLAALSYLKSLKVPGDIYLVCSGWVENGTQLKGLGELSDKELKKHYETKVKLTQNDITLADNIWRLYCSDDHRNIKNYMTTKSSFAYLSNCLNAHLKRFPNVASGLNVLETNILKIIDKETIKSERQLIGYALQYQGFYGFGDLQIRNIIQKLTPFYETKNGKIVLNRDGLLAKDQLKNFYDQLADDTVYGHCKKYDHCYHAAQQIITKHE